MIPRRDFLNMVTGSITLALADIAASSTLPMAAISAFFLSREANAAALEHIDPLQNPKFLPLFLERYRAFHESKLGGSAWNKDFLKFWRDEFSRPRDFVQKASGGWLWPRFQWIYTFKGRDFDFTNWRWFELEEPERFRNTFEKTIGWKTGTNWCGVEGNLKNATFFRKTQNGFAGECFEFKKKIAEVSWRIDKDSITANDGHQDIWKERFRQHVLPANRSTIASLLQKKVSNEFLIVPHAQRLSLIDNREWLFFP